MEENRVRDIYELERILLPIFEKLANNETDYDAPDLTDDEGSQMLKHICYLMRKDLEGDDREQDYDLPEGNLNSIADLWTKQTGHMFTPIDVASIMTGSMIGRIKNGGGSVTESHHSICEKCMFWQCLNAEVGFTCVYALDCDTKNNFCGFKPRLIENEDDLK